MNKIDAQIAREQISEYLSILRLDAEQQRQAVKLLERMHGELIGKVATSVTNISKARAQKLLISSEELIKFYYDVIATGQAKTLDDLTGYVTESTHKIMIDVGVTAALPPPKVIQSLIDKRLVLGAPSAEWWDKQAVDLTFKFTNEIRQGIAQGETIDQMVKRITPIIDTSKRGARALISTSTQQVFNDATLATFRENSDVLNGIEQLSTMDSHTTPICLAYDGASYDLNGNPINGTTLPMGSIPRHFNCRSIWMPITKSWKELGVDIGDVPPGKRASDEGPISAKITMADYLKGKPREELDARLGKGKAELFLDGKITLRDLLDQSGRPLTLKEIKELKNL